MREHSLTVARLPLMGALALALAFSGPALADDLQLRAIQVAPSQSAQQAELVLTLSAASSGSAVSAFTMQNPDRLIIDIADAEVAADVADDVAGGGLITDISLETIDDGDGVVARVVVSLSGPVEQQITSSGAEVRVRLIRTFTDSEDPLATSPSETTGSDIFVATDPGEDRPLSGPEELGGSVALTSLDFDKGDTTDRLIIGVRGTTAYTDTRPRSSTLIIDVPGAFVPQSLTRPIDTSNFISPVRSVRAYRTSNGARITVTLRSDVEYSIRKADGLLIVDIPVPASMQEERSRAAEAGYSVAPSGGTGSGDGSIQNISREEILIGGSGRTADPNSAFAPGYGSSGGSNQIGANGFMYDSASATDLPYTGRQISLDFVNADIHSIFRLISSVSRLNIVAGDDVSGTVTVRMENVPWDQALAAILQAKGLASQRFGNIVRVAPLETIKTEQQMALET
ncbi:MAG: type IV pilus assembly protein PilQ, partial [Myxococcota bacterium]